MYQIGLARQSGGGYVLTDFITRKQGSRMSGRAVECTGLENRRGCKPSVSSNLTSSASFHRVLPPLPLGSQFPHTCIMKANLKSRLLELYEGNSVRAHRFRYTLLGLDIATLGFLIFSSFFYKHPAIDWLECAFGAYILCDFLARLYIAPNSFSFLIRMFSIIDMLVIVSFFLPVDGQSFAFLRALSVVRLLRSAHILERLRRDVPFFRKYEDMLISATNLLLFIFVMTELVFQTQVERNEDIHNFVDAMYFTVTTLTTTGFGDIVLEGNLGRLLTVIIMIFGVSLFLRLVQTILRPHKVRFECPQCGLYLHDRDAVHCKACGTVLAIPDEGMY